MGTQNKAVTAYLPENIEKQLALYCTKHGITRQGKKSGKDKPALGTAIVEVLKLFFAAENLPEPLVKPENMAVLSENIEAKMLKLIEKKLGDLPNREWVKTEIDQAIATLNTEKIPIVPSESSPVTKQPPASSKKSRHAIIDKI